MMSCLLHCHLRFIHAQYLSSNIHSVYFFNSLVNRPVAEKKGKEASEEERNQKIQQADESLDRDGGSEGDYSDVDDEGADGYKPGGYHKVEIGDRFNNRRYTVIRKLGWVGNLKDKIQ